MLNYELLSTHADRDSRAAVYVVTRALRDWFNLPESCSPMKRRYPAGDFGDIILGACGRSSRRIFPPAREP